MSTQARTSDHVIFKRRWPPFYGDAILGIQPQEKIIDNVLISLSGFTKSEIMDIVGYIRSVEPFRPTRLVHVRLEDPDMNLEEARRIVLELWPEPGGPPFMATLKREKTEG